MCLCVSGFLYFARTVVDNIDPNSRVGRHLLASGGCATRMVDDEEVLDYESWIIDGGVALHFVGVLFLFLGIAIVCDDFFVASLEAISEKLKLSEDVAGATFMAAGSSAPELFSSMMALANPSGSSEIGVGTIVGSAVFNVLAIIGVTAIFAGQTLYLDWKPVTRDCLFYSMAVLSVILIFLDGMIKWYEGMGATLAYGCYIIFMKFNSQIMAYVDDLTRSKKVKPGEDEEVGSKEEGGALNGDSKDSDAIGAAGSGEGGEGEGDDDEEESANPFKPPDSARDYPLWLLSLPWYAVFTITIPDCTKPRWDKWYMVSFIMSIVWIGVISWFMVDWCVVIGCVLNVPLSVMGVTVLAAGTSIPDALSSIVVAKQGQGDMAVANAIGSNVFDIWLGLGLPWWIFLLIDKVKDDKPGLCVSTKELLPNVIILFSVLGVYFGMLVVFRFRLLVRVGILFVLIYVIFAVYQIVAVWRFDIYDIDTPDISECICHVRRDSYVTTACMDASKQDDSPYAEWWKKNAEKYVDEDQLNPEKWRLENGEE